MSAFSIGNFDITDMETYMQYAAKARETIEKYSGIPRIIDHEFSVVEGEPCQLLVVFEFPSMEEAKAWYNSKEYQEVIPLRKRSTSNGWIMFTDKIIMPFGIK